MCLSCHLKDRTISNIKKCNYCNTISSGKGRYKVLKSMRSVSTNDFLSDRNMHHYDQKKSVFVVAAIRGMDDHCHDNVFVKAQSDWRADLLVCVGQVCSPVTVATMM